MSEAIKKKYATDPNYRRNCGRKPVMPAKEIVEIVEQLGFKEAAIKLEIHIEALRGRYYRLRNK